MRHFAVIIWLKNRATPLRVPVSSQYHNDVSDGEIIRALSEAINNVIGTSKHTLSLGENQSFNIVVNEIQAFNIVRGL